MCKQAEKCRKCKSCPMSVVIQEKRAGGSHINISPIKK
ncbi:hypothetical protein QY97_02796 [Bacillus thermotolerans]|uniref:Uncharacterized protein n=1 Tax=Bacillus thermotolerans TaxID=1221996 RepID=A0A0F5HYD7_BACTR|nr:hypothetical protein QY97_02796 [Bacillus thermotolerans]KKB39809.1 hypothetical protein QY95_02026 [Bacillus thermotolerans]KKB44247.1 hypothetical protein QY96_03269 [Bacillus thermotolerans]